MSRNEKEYIVLINNLSIEVEPEKDYYEENWAAEKERWIAKIKAILIFEVIDSSKNSTYVLECKYYEKIGTCCRTGF